VGHREPHCGRPAVPAVFLLFTFDFSFDLTVIIVIIVIDRRDDDIHAEPITPTTHRFPGTWLQLICPPASPSLVTCSQKLVGYGQHHLAEVESNQLKWKSAKCSLNQLHIIQLLDKSTKQINQHINQTHQPTYQPTHQPNTSTKHINQTHQPNTSTNFPQFPTTSHNIDSQHHTTSTLNIKQCNNWNRHLSLFGLFPGSRQGYVQGWNPPVSTWLHILPTHLAYTSCLQLPSFFVMNTHRCKFQNKSYTSTHNQTKHFPTFPTT
jgi:hypothetical protein